MLKIAIIGRPNVGKSTLFNRLVGKKLAIVDDTPGVTRDRREAPATVGGLDFTLVDTAGLEDAETESLESHMMHQTEQALKACDMILFAIDGRDGLLAVDEEFATWVRKIGKPTLLLANKCEGKKFDTSLHEAMRLGFGEPVFISAEHGLGLLELEEAIVDLAKKHKLDFESVTEEDIKNSEILHISIAGRPNVGKSTLFNQLIDEERAIVSPIAGTTRDAVTVDWEYKGTPVKLVDTAGMRKRTQRNKDRIEKLSVDDSFRSIQYANVVVLLIDGTQPLEKVELQIADHIVTEGRGLVIAINKWDLVEDKKHMLNEIDTKIRYDLAQAKGAPVVTMSALHNKGVNAVMQAVMEVNKAWNMRINTGKLNTWLDQATAEHLPPLAQGQRIRFKYITQIKSRPPTFALFTSSKIKDLPDSYIRYLSNSLKESFDFHASPLRLFLRKSENPYEGKKKKTYR